MIQGWHDENYLIVFEGQTESKTMTERYALGQYLPDYSLVGIYGWDDFVVRNASGQFFTIPTVPLDAKYLRPCEFSKIELSRLRFDQRFANKVKWYIKPLIFGGDARAENNIAWLDLDQHIEAVKWWNQTYISSKRGG